LRRGFVCLLRRRSRVPAGQFKMHNESNGSRATVRRREIEPGKAGRFQRQKNDQIHPKSLMKSAI
jgi:hypothetical protein